jgi:hypothetical protein
VSCQVRTVDGALVVGIGMTATTYFTAVGFTPHRHNRDEVARELTEFAGPGFMRFAQTAGVDHRSLALPLSRYPKMTGFTEASNA